MNLFFNFLDKSEWKYTFHSKIDILQTPQI